MTENTENTEIEVSHDELISEIDARRWEEGERQSDAGESAAKTREFLDRTGLNSQAFSWSKSILKKLPKKDGTRKAMDIIRSLEVTLPMLKDHVRGQQSEMDLEDDDAPAGNVTKLQTKPEEEIEPFDPEQAASK